jgi:hypothetical protein
MKVEQEEGWEKIRYRFIFLQGEDGYEEMTRNGERISFITVWMETTCQLVQHISTLSQLFDRYVFLFHGNAWSFNYSNLQVVHPLFSSYLHICHLSASLHMMLGSEHKDT